MCFSFSIFHSDELHVFDFPLFHKVIECAESEPFEYLFRVISLVWVIQFMQMHEGRFLNRGDLILVFHIVLTAFSLLEFHRLREQDLNSVLSCVLITELLNLNQSLLYLIH